MCVNIAVATTLKLHILRLKVCYKIHKDSFKVVEATAATNNRRRSTPADERNEDF
jgi:hypothetical protein